MYPKLEVIFEQQKNNMQYVREKGYLNKVSAMAEVLIEALKKGNKILVAGNGGSAADAQHFAGELVGRFLKERQGIPAIALTTDTSVITSVGNDYGYDSIFARQLEALGNRGDIFLGISTSGNSQNIIRAVEEAAERGITTMGLLGKEGGRLKELCDYEATVPLEDTPRIQEFHIMTVHMLCELIEEAIAK